MPSSGEVDRPGPAAIWRSIEATVALSGGAFIRLSTVRKVPK